MSKVKKFSGEKVKQAREELGMSQRALSLLIDVTDTTVWSWESGNTFPTALNLYPLASALRKSVDWFFEDDDAPR